MLSQESRIKLQSLINYQEVTHIAVNDYRTKYGEVYSSANVNAICDLETMLKILAENGLTHSKPGDFVCDHGSFLSVGHSFHGTIEGCDISFIVTHEIKKETLQRVPQENTQFDYTTEWTTEEIMRQEG